MARSRPPSESLGFHLTSDGALRASSALKKTRPSAARSNASSTSLEGRIVATKPARKHPPGLVGPAAIPLSCPPDARVTGV